MSLEHSPTRTGQDIHPAHKAVLNVDEFCAAASIGRNKFYDELKLGRIHAKKSGRRTLIPVTELTAWLDRLPEAAA